MMDKKLSATVRGALRRLALLRVFIIVVLFLSFTRVSADPFLTERTIIRLSQSWHGEMLTVLERESLLSFCSDDAQRQIIFNLLDEIHYYHDVLEADLQSNRYDHSSRTIRRILKQIEKLDAEYRSEDFAEFFREQCWARSRINRYSGGFGVHSYGGRLYVQEAIIDWYLKRLTKRIGRIKKHVEHFYVRRMVSEY